MMRRSDGFTLIELMIVIAIIAIMVVMAIPSLQHARKSANETSAIGFLKVSIGIHIRYRLRFNAFPRNEDDLYNADLLEPSQIPSGYELGFSSTAATWGLQADPELPGTSGDRYFFADNTGVIRFSLTGSASTVSEPIGEK